ncbi:MAG: hypothetical protein HRF44_02730 [Ignavibacterium sp.]|jgi:uncharacterized membrane protein YphA (DoxX/SURF4 family)
MHPATFRHKVVETLSVALGILFLAAGSAKIPSLSAFAHTISSVVYFDADVAFVAAVIVVAAEILGGLALVLRILVTYVSVLFCILLALLLWILTSAAVQGREIQCHCFGVLAIALENRHEILLDLLLFNLFAFLALASLPRRQGATTGRKWIFAGLVLAMLYAQYTAFGGLILGDRPDDRPSLDGILGYLRSHNVVFPHRTEGNRVLFLLHFPDFNCPPCFDTFVRSAELAQAGFGEAAHERMIAVFKPGQIADPTEPSRIERWAARIGLRFPVLIGPDSVFRALHLEKSSVFIVSPSDVAVFSGSFPLGEEQMSLYAKLLQADYVRRR